MSAESVGAGSRRAPDFDRLYRLDPDPFGVERTWYERRKQATALALLPRERYRFAWDAAAGTGALAVALEQRCDRVLASDAAPIAVDRLRGRGLDAMLNRLPDVPSAANGADLVVLSEVLYYLDPSAARQAIDAIIRSAAPGTDLLSVHWLGTGPDLAVPGADATEALDAAVLDAGWRRLVHLDDEGFALRCWRNR